MKTDNEGVFVSGTVANTLNVGDVADEAGHLLEGALDGHHPQRHRDLLEVADDLLDVREVALQALIRDVLDPGILDDHLVRDDELVSEAGSVGARNFTA